MGGVRRKGLGDGYLDLGRSCRITSVFECD